MPDPTGADIEERAAAVARRGKTAAIGAVSDVRGRIRDAERRLEDEASAWDAHAEAAVLPDVGVATPMADLAIRIDRESDYWRTFAVRNLRPGAARNLAIAGAALALASGARARNAGDAGRDIRERGPVRSVAVDRSGRGALRARRMSTRRRIGARSRDGRARSPRARRSRRAKAGARRGDPGASGREPREVRGSADAASSSAQWF